MSIAAGTPTVIDQIKALWDQLRGQATATDQTVLNGLHNDFSQAIGQLEKDFGPVVSAVESDAYAEVTGLLHGIASAVPVGGFTSFSQASAAILSVAHTLSPGIAAQLGNIQSTAIQTLIGAALQAAGHVNLAP